MIGSQIIKNTYISVIILKAAMYSHINRIGWRHINWTTTSKQEMNESYSSECFAQIKYVQYPEWSCFDVINVKGYYGRKNGRWNDVTLNKYKKLFWRPLNVEESSMCATGKTLFSLLHKTLEYCSDVYLAYFFLDVLNVKKDVVSTLCENYFFVYVRHFDVVLILVKHHFEVVDVRWKLRWYSALSVKYLSLKCSKVEY